MLLYSRMGRFCPFFWNFMKSLGFAVPLGTIWGTTNFFFWFKNLQRSIISKKSKGQKIKIIFFFEKCVFNANIILVENQILDKTSF